jgi:hypothetical protein
MPNKKSPKPVSTSAPVIAVKRIFKTAEASKVAAKRGISDADVCKAVKQLIAGGKTKLPGGVYKKRINNNLDRAIVLCRDGANNWIFVGLFQKNELDNITNAELGDYQVLAKIYATLSDDGISKLLIARELMEICNEKETVNETGRSAGKK